MAKDDIYGNKGKYERFISDMERFTKKPTKPKWGRKAKYYIKNKENLKYFYKLIDHFELKDLSFIRRLRMLYVLKLITFVIEKDLATAIRKDINELVKYSHTRYNTVTSKRDFIKDLKAMWRVLFPEKDQKGRIDETIVPYVVRHLTKKIDKSKETLRDDRLTTQEFKKLVQYFGNDPRMQAYIMLAYESLGRPQEILSLRLKNIVCYDNYAKVWIADHGKEGPGLLQCIDSYPYVLRWLQVHPFNDDPEYHVFIVLNNNNKYGQMNPHAMSLRLRRACKYLGINKRITCYSLKRNGVTHRRRIGQSDLQIQHAARWTSTKQLQIYDMTTQQDAFEMELERRGMKQKQTKEEDLPKTKQCKFCSHSNGFTASFCYNCQRPLDRDAIAKQAAQQERFINNKLIQRLDSMEEMFQTMIATSRSQAQ